MNKKIIAVLSVIMIPTLFGGCQLAVENDGAAQNQDALCGVFITLEPIEPPAPTETVIELPATWNGNMNDVLFNEEDSRIYAARHEEDNGSVDYTFDGNVGYRMFSITEMNPDGSEKYQATIGDPEWQDVSSNYSTTDNGNDISLTGTLCFDVHYACRVYTNPVYQTADGRVYCTYGNSYFYDMLDKLAGDWGSTSISATTTQTVNGEATSRSLEAVVKLAGMNTNKQVILKQMDEDDKVIDQTVITQDAIPDSILVLPNTAYMILEEHSLDSAGKAAVNRTMVKTDEEYLNARFTGENGIIESSMVTLVH